MFDKIKGWLISGAGKIVFNYALNLVIELILKRIEKYKEDLDWEKVKTDCISLIRNKVPSVFLQNICIAILDSIIELFEGLLMDVWQCKAIRAKLAEGDLKGAKKLVLNYIKARLL